MTTKEKVTVQCTTYITENDCPVMKENYSCCEVIIDSLTFRLISPSIRLHYITSLVSTYKIK